MKNFSPCISTDVNAGGKMYFRRYWALIAHSCTMPHFEYILYIFDLWLIYQMAFSTFNQLNWWSDQQSAPRDPLTGFKNILHIPKLQHFLAYNWRTEEWQYEARALPKGPFIQDAINAQFLYCLRFLLLPSSPDNAIFEAYFFAFGKSREWSFFAD